MQRISRYLVVLLPLFFACKKDKDKEAPVIRIDTPLRNSTIQAGNYIHVTGYASDNKKLEYVTLKVLSIDGNTQLAAPVSVPVSGAEAHIDQYLAVGDIHTSYGTYQVIVEAGDGTNKNKSYVEIIVNEIARTFKKLIVVRKSGTGYVLDSLAGGSLTGFLVRPEDVSTAVIDNYSQFLYVTGKTQGSVMGYNLATKSVQWNHPADVPSTGSPVFFTSVYDNNQHVLWQSMAGGTGNTVQAIGLNGNTQKTLVMQPLKHAGALLVSGSNIIAGESPSASGGSSLLSYYYASGFGLEFSTTAPLDAVKIFTLSSHELVMIGNSAGQGELRIYDRNTNGFWEQVNLPAGKVYDAVQLDANTYIIAHSSGLIRFEHSPTNMITISPGHAVQVLQLDTYSGALYAGEGNALKVFDPVTGNELTSVSSADSIKAILLHYNK